MEKWSPETALWPGAEFHCSLLLGSALEWTCSEQSDPTGGQPPPRPGPAIVHSL